MPACMRWKSSWPKSAPKRRSCVLLTRYLNLPMLLCPHPARQGMHVSRTHACSSIVWGEEV